jgi:phospholipase D-like protein
VLRYLPYLLVIALWIFAFVDCLGTPAHQVRALPKVVWILIILLFGEVLVGPVAWLVAGRRRAPAAAGGATPAQCHREVRPGRPQPQGEWIAPDDNPEFLRSLAELNKKRDGRDGPHSEGE